MVDKSIFIAILGCILFASSASASECSALKRDYTSITERGNDKKSLDSYLTSLKPKIAAADQCAQNILGRIYFEGKIVPRDADKAIAIFNDLSNRGYPPAMYNLAYALIKTEKSDPKTIILLLNGIMYGYYGTSEWGTVASDARELGWDYITYLEKSGPQPELREMQTRASDENVLKLATKVQERSNAIHRDAADIANVIGILGMGAAIHNMAAPQCGWAGCGHPMSTGELYGLGILH